jgi:outer membrane protein assembly factor BamB
LRRLLNYIFLGAVLTALFACSSEVTNPPMELESFKAKVKVSKLWAESVGDGDEQYRLDLEPFISGPSVFTVDVNGEVSSLDVSDGDEQWVVELDTKISAGISGDSRRVYLLSFQGELIALDRTNGAELWRVKLGSEALSAAESDGFTVVVHASDGRVYAFNAFNGLQLWRYDSATPVLSLRGTAQPVIIGDRVIVSFANGEVVALSLQDGLKAWEVSLAQPSGRTELERLIDADGNLGFDSNRLYAVAYQGDLKAIDLVTGSEVWSQPLSSYTGVQLSSDLVVVSTAQGEVAAFDKFDSKEAWRNRKLLYRRLGQVAVLEGYALVADFEGYIHFLDMVDGSFAARIRPDSDGVMGRMKVVENTLYVYTRSGDLYAYQLKR